jgi:hypothetical protein
VVGERVPLRDVEKSHHLIRDPLARVVCLRRRSAITSL